MILNIELDGPGVITNDEGIVELPTVDLIKFSLDDTEDSNENVEVESK